MMTMIFRVKVKAKNAFLYNIVTLFMKHNEVENSDNETGATL